MLAVLSDWKTNDIYNSESSGFHGITVQTISVNPTQLSATVIDRPEHKINYKDNLSTCKLSLYTRCINQQENGWLQLCACNIRVILVFIAEQNHVNKTI